jgi:selenide,water dikinase
MAVTPRRERLTSLSHGAGCACKLGPLALGSLLSALPTSSDPNLLVAFDTADDAGVYRVSDDLALVLTADFFTPILDDPYDFGRVAATNALSDVYAMGGTPVMAINLVAFSISDLGEHPLREILRGGAAVAKAAAVALAGGHSIDDPEPKYGMAVVGTVDPDKLLTNAGGRPGDELYLTKPVGSGLVTTAAKRDLASPELIAAATQVMCERNAEAATEAVAAGASAATDVTGFGLLGHLHELTKASGLAAELEHEAVPVIDGVLELAENPACVAGGTRRNLEYIDRFTHWPAGIPYKCRVVAADAMTSGGLLIAVSPQAGTFPPGIRIGRLVAGSAGSIRVI